MDLVAMDMAMRPTHEYGCEFASALECCTDAWTVLTISTVMLRTET
jgi:hypothetical protein